MTAYKKLQYDDTKVQVESAIRDGEGVKISTNYAKKTEIKDGTLTINTNGGSTLGTFSANQSTNQTVTLPNGSVQLLNQSVTFVSDSTYEEFPYRASVTVSGVTSTTYAEVTYSEEQATSLNFATFCDTATNVIYLYSRTDVGTVTIPTISIGMDYSDITIDATPTSGSGNAVSSGGVYTALATKQNTLTFDSTPTDGSSNPVTSGGIYTALGNYVTLGTTQTITSQKKVTPSIPFKFRQNRATTDVNNNETYQYIDYVEKDDNARIGVIGSIMSANPNGASDILRGVYLQGGNQCAFRVLTNGTSGVIDSWGQRAYNVNNGGDIVTIGTLSNYTITLGGIAITKSLGASAGDDFKVIKNGSTTCAVDTIYNYGDGYGYWNTLIVSSGTQSRLVHRMNTSGSVTIYIEKWVNGTYSISQLHSV